jgi:hypothetical protein
VAALDPVEVVRVPGPVFRRLCERFPKLKDGMKTAPRPAVPGVAKAPPPAVLRDYVRQGLYQGQRLLVLDLKSCTRCDECTKAWRRLARRERPAVAGGAAVRRLPGGDVVPVVPEAVLHGGVPGGRDPPPRRPPGGGDREPLHRVRAVREELPLRGHPHDVADGGGRTRRRWTTRPATR